MPRPYTRLRETTFDLYVERDLLPGYYKAIAVASSWLVLAGYILFAVDFTSRDEDLSAERNLITAVAGSLLILGYLGIVITALFGRSLLFLIDGVIIPTLTASFLGLFLTIANFALHPKLPTPQIYMSVPLVTACVTTVVAAVMLVVAYRELAKIRKTDERRRWHVQMGRYGNNPPDHTMLGIPGPDDEAQRRQLMRLLSERHETMSSVEEIQNTFKIDLPGEPRQENRRAVAVERRGNSPVRRGFGLANLLPWKHEQTVPFKDARERRREEIERSSISNLGDVWRNQSPSQYQPPQSPAWGWPPATRYA